VASIAERSKSLLLALDQVDLVLSPSKFLRDLMISSGMSADRIRIARYGITPPVLQPRNRSDHQGLRVGYMSQLAPHKGVDVLIEALRLLPEASIEARIYGDPQPHAEYTDRLKRTSQSDTRLTFYGAYDHREIYDILAPLDVVVVPSLWYENSPFVIQEAQAAHVPVVASRLGGMRELVTDETNGLLFEPGNPHDLARQLRRLLDDRVLLERLQSRDTFVRTVEDEMRELSAHYRQLCST
jgi:glycosyltransferase involved in cell wall biosynthesis